ncbi:MAG: S9 family peptidase [Bacteroidales bacterium]|nr:S9 family peptidase [Bacteroidales bacterium]
MKSKLLVMLISSAVFTSACSGGGEKAVEETPISRSSIKVENGLLTPEIMHSMGKVSDPQISPDGKEILYGVSFTSIEQNRNNRELFIMNLDGTNNRQITSTPKSENNARWINDGREILFLMSGELWKMNRDGNKRVKVGEYGTGISEFELSPSGNKILFVSNIKSIQKSGDVWSDLPKGTGRMIDKLMYRHWDRFVEDIPHPFVAEFDGKNISNVFDILEGEPYESPTLPLSGIEQLSWSPDGTKILYASRKLTGVEYAYSTNTDIYLFDIETKSHKNLTEGMPGYDTDPVFSPDGKHFAWLSMERAGFEADKHRLFVMNFETGEKRDLTANYKYNADSPVWLPDGSGLYFNSCVNAVTGIYQVNLDSENIRKITEGWFDFGKVSVAGEKLIALYRSMSMPNEIVSVDPITGEYSQISDENGHLLSQITMGRVEERWIKTVDNKDMHMWVVYPPGFDPEKKYPAILFCSGGPQGVMSQNWSYRWNFQLMAANGYVIILPNRRGTTAFGQEWTDQISGDYMGLNMQDYISSVKEMKREKFIDKVGASGASYGGYSIFYLAGIHKGMFSAFVSHAGIFNQEHMYMTTEELWFPHWDNGGAPWDDNPVAKRHYAHSPHKFVKNWDTPILVTHGELDYRVPVDQGMAAFNAAQALGVPSEMLLFPDENHWILKPQNSIQWNRVYFRWFDKWLKN